MPAAAEIVGDALDSLVQLALDGAGGYVLSGTVVSAAQAPTYLANWGVAAATTNLPAGTNIRFHIVDGSGAPLPDTALPGNATGFTSSVDLSSLSTSTYPVLALSADLTTSSTSTTPLLQNWSLSYGRGPIPFGTVPFTLTGTKTIGSTGSGDPIYKTSVSTATGASGTVSQPLEWDGYTMSLTTYDVTSACNAPPYSLSPGATTISNLMIGSSTPNMVLVNVSDTSGAVSGASVTLTNGAYTNTFTSDSCGSAYFGGLSSGTYTITVSKTGYTTFNGTSSVSGHVFYPVSME